MPAPITFSHQLVQRQAEARKSGVLPWLRPDAKSQVTCRYEGGKVVGIEHCECIGLVERKLSQCPAHIPRLAVVLFVKALKSNSSVLSCYLRSVVCPYPQCLGRLSGFWKPAPLAAADTVCKLRYSVLWLLSVVVLFYGLFCPSAVAVSVLGRVLSLRHCRAAAHGALASLGLPAAGLAWAALAAAVSAAPAGHLRGAVGSFPRIRRLKYTLHALLRKAGLLHRANIARTS